VRKMNTKVIPNFAKMATAGFFQTISNSSFSLSLRCCINFNTYLLPFTQEKTVNMLCLPGHLRILCRFESLSVRWDDEVLGNWIFDLLE
jgi:hypothetical protein